jgi:hypothetical protein
MGHVRHGSTATTEAVRRANRTIKDATAKRFQYDGHDQLRSQSGRTPQRLHLHPCRKIPKGLTPTNKSAKSGQSSPKFQLQSNPSNARTKHRC